MGWRGGKGRKGAGGGGQDGGQTNATAAKTSANATTGGSTGDVGSNSEPRLVDPQMEGINAWLTATSDYVHKHDKLVNPFKQEIVNMHDGMFWVSAGSQDPQNPGTVVNPPFEIADLANRHRALPQVADPAPVGPAAAVNAHRAYLAWLRVYWDSRLAQNGNTVVLGPRVGAGGVHVVKPTEADYANERLCSMQEFNKVQWAVFPGSQNKATRAQTSAKLDECNRWAAAMLKALPKVLKNGPVRAELEAVLTGAARGSDEEFQRRERTGLVLYQLNYVVAVTMSQVPGSAQAAQHRARNWANAMRAKGSTQHEWRTKLTELGLMQTPPIQEADADYKSRFISGAALGANVDHFRAFCRVANCTQDELLLKSATGLATVLGDILAEQQNSAQLNSSTATTSSSNNNKAQDGKPVAAGQSGSNSSTSATNSNQGGGNKGQGSKQTKNPQGQTAGGFKGECFNCHKVGHRSFECPDKQQQDKPTAKAKGQDFGGKTRKVLAAQVAELEEKLKAEKANNKRKRDESTSDESDMSDTDPEAAAIKAVKTVLAAAQRAEKKHKGAAQLRGSKYGGTY